MVNPSLADKTPEKRYEKRVTVSFPFKSLESPWMWNCPGTRSPGSQSCPDDFSEMIYCGALFCPVALVLFCWGCITLLPLPLIHPVSSFPFTGTFYTLPCTGSSGWDGWKAQHCCPERDQGRKRAEGGQGRGCGCTGSPGWWGAWEEKKGHGQQGAGHVNRLYLCWEAEQVGKKPLSYTSALCLSCWVRHWDRQLESPADEAALISRFDLTHSFQLGIWAPKTCQTGIKWQKIEWIVKQKIKSRISCLVSNSKFDCCAMSSCNFHYIQLYFKERRASFFTSALSYPLLTLIVQGDCPRSPKVSCDMLAYKVVANIPQVLEASCNSLVLTALPVGVTGALYSS